MSDSGIVGLGPWMERTAGPQPPRPVTHEEARRALGLPDRLALRRYIDEQEARAADLTALRERAETAERERDEARAELAAIADVCDAHGGEGALEAMQRWWGRLDGIARERNEARAEREEARAELARLQVAPPSTDVATLSKLLTMAEGERDDARRIADHRQTLLEEVNAIADRKERELEARAAGAGVDADVALMDLAHARRERDDAIAARTHARADRDAARRDEVAAYRARDAALGRAGVVTGARMVKLDEMAQGWWRVACDQPDYEDFYLRVEDAASLTALVNHRADGGAVGVALVALSEED